MSQLVKESGSSIIGLLILVRCGVSSSDHRPQEQWRRNQFESGGIGLAPKWGHQSGAKRRKNFLVVPFHFFRL